MGVFYFFICFLLKLGEIVPHHVGVPLCKTELQSNKIKQSKQQQQEKTYWELPLFLRFTLQQVEACVPGAVDAVGSVFH